MPTALECHIVNLSEHTNSLPWHTSHFANDNQYSHSSLPWPQTWRLPSQTLAEVATSPTVELLSSFPVIPLLVVGIDSKNRSKEGTDVLWHTPRTHE